MGLRLVLLISLFILLFSSPATAAEPGTGTIEGQLVNGTAGGSSVADLEVTLNINLNGAGEEPAVTRTDAEGRFFFEGLATALGYEYQTSLFYQKAEYIGDWISFNEGEEAKTVEITVYDATTSSEYISVTTAHTIVYVGEGALDIKEYYLFFNDSDRTYIGPTNDPETNGVLSFSLPMGVINFTPSIGLMECCISNSEGGFTESMPLNPGMREVSYTYRVPYAGGDYTLGYQSDYPINNYNLLVQGYTVQVSSPQLAQSESLEISGNTYQHFTGYDLLPRSPVTVNLSGLPNTGSEAAFPWVTLVLMVIILGGSGIFLLLRKKAGPENIAVPVADNEQDLLREIASLDDAFESGRIDEEHYHETRKEKKQLLLNLMGGGNRENS